MDLLIEATSFVFKTDECDLNFHSKIVLEFFSLFQAGVAREHRMMEMYRAVVHGIEKSNERELRNRRKVRTGLNHVWITGHKSFFLFPHHFHLTLSWSCLVYRTCWILLIFPLFICCRRRLRLRPEKGKQNIFHGENLCAHSHSEANVWKSYLATFLSFNLLLTLTSHPGT